MSEVAQVALIAGGIGFLTTLATILFNLWARSKEREGRLAERQEDNREWYRRTLFERRLAAVQEASWWLAQLNDAIDPDPESADDGGLLLLNRAEQARQWYGKNLLYIHGDIPDKCPVAGFFLLCYWHARGYGDIPDSRLWQAASDLLKQKALELLKTLDGEKRNDF